MKGRLTLWTAPLLVVLLLALYPAGAGADTRYIQTTGTATGDGKKTITIETVSLATGKAQVSRAMSLYVVDVTISNGSSAASTTIKIRDSLDVALPAEFIVSILPSNIVEINRTLGAFTMSLSGSVPSQTIQEISYPPHTFGMPMIGGPWAPILLSLCLLAAGAIYLTRCRRVSWGTST
ncbi:MAG TPA: hypothetical protein VGK93_08390 [Candidatus Eisenbacteria bacterium]|jgi:hypothetical protein